MASKKGGVPKTYEFKEVDGSKTIVAARNLKPGTLILTEKPILCAKSVEEVVENFEKLSVKDKEKVLEMTNKINPDQAEEGGEKEDNKSKLTKLFYSNTMNAAGQALYYVLSRVKHSCGPNIALVTKPDTYGHIEVRACRAIKKGGELRADYLPGIYLFETKEMRMKVLGVNYSCDCGVCKLEGNDAQENETTRFRIKENYRNTTIYVTFGDFLQALEHCKTMLGFMDYLDEEVVVKKVSVTLECWQLAVLAQLQRPEADLEVEKYKEKARTLCKLLGPIEEEKWSKTEKLIAEERLEELDTVKLRASGPWTIQIIKTLLKKDVVPAEPAVVEEAAKPTEAATPTEGEKPATEAEKPAAETKPEESAKKPRKKESEEKTDSEKATSSVSESNSATKTSSKTSKSSKPTSKPKKTEKKEDKSGGKKIEDNKAKSDKKTAKKNDKADEKLNIKSKTAKKPKAKV